MVSLVKIGFAADYAVAARIDLALQSAEDHTVSYATLQTLLIHIYDGDQTKECAIIHVPIFLAGG